MKKALFCFAIVAASMLMFSCGNTGNNNGPSFATDSLTYDHYSWFTLKASVPQGKGYVITEDQPKAIADVAVSSMFYIVGDKVVIAINDFDSYTIAERKELLQKNGLEKEKQGIEDVKVAGRNAFRWPYMLLEGNELTKYGYYYEIDFSEYSQAGWGGYNMFEMIVYPADGQPNKIDDLLNDEEVKYILDNLVFTPRE